MAYEKLESLQQRQAILQLLLPILSLVAAENNSATEAALLWQSPLETANAEARSAVSFTTPLQASPVSCCSTGTRRSRC